MVLFGCLQHVRVAVRQHHQPITGLQSCQRFGHFWKAFQPFDGRNQRPDVIFGMGDSGSVHYLTNRQMPDLPIRHVLPIQQRIDHRVFKMGAPPPCDEGVRIAGPALGLKEWGGEIAQATLHVHDRAVLVEHAQLDGGFQVIDDGHSWLPVLVRAADGGPYRQGRGHSEQAEQPQCGMSGTRHAPRVGQAREVRD